MIQPSHIWVYTPTHQFSRTRFKNNLCIFRCKCIKMKLKIVYSLLCIFVTQGNLKALGSTIIGGYFNKSKHSANDIILVNKNIGPKMCVRHCFLLNTCMAVNYIRNEFKCELLGTISSMTALQHRNGSDYTEVDRWHMVRKFFLYFQNALFADINYTFLWNYCHHIAWWHFWTAYVITNVRCKLLIIPLSIVQLSLSMIIFHIAVYHHSIILYILHTISLI